MAREHELALKKSLPPASRLPSSKRPDNSSTPPKLGVSFNDVTSLGTPRTSLPQLLPVHSQRQSFTGFEDIITLFACFGDQTGAPISMPSRRTMVRR